MIIKPFQDRFHVLKRNGCHIQYVLDIGAYRGDFTHTVNSVWSSALIRQIEADERQRQYLNSNAIIALLGDKEQSEVDFYTLDEDKITTGSSIFLELTSHYSPTQCKIIKKSMTTLDKLDEKHNFYGNWMEYGLLKIDTQGSELLILDGANNFLQKRQPKYILLECSVQEYNSGAPRFFEVVSYMNKLKYSVMDIFDQARDAHDNLLQVDLLFTKDNK